MPISLKLGHEERWLTQHSRIPTGICGVYRYLLSIAEYFGLLGYSGIIFFI
jgi:hypothetical protein